MLRCVALECRIGSVRLTDKAAMVLMFIQATRCCESAARCEVSRSGRYAVQAYANKTVQRVKPVAKAGIGGSR